MKEFRFLHRGIILSFKELMEKLNLNDEKAVKIVIDEEGSNITIYTELGNISGDKEITNIRIKEGEKSENK